MATNPYLADKHLAFCWEVGYTGRPNTFTSDYSIRAWQHGDAARRAEAPVVTSDEREALAVCAKYVGAREHDGHYFLDDKPWNALLDDGDAWRLARRARWAIVPRPGNLIDPHWIAGPIDERGKVIEVSSDREPRTALVVGLGMTIARNARATVVRLREMRAARDSRKASA